MARKQTFSKEQLERLQRFEEPLRTAVRSRYARRIGERKDCEELADIYYEATGIRLRAVPSCGECMLRLLTCIGTAYFTDLDIIAQKAAKEVSASDAPARVKKAVRVKAVEEVKK